MSKIYVLDDDPNACVLAEKALKAEGFEVIWDTEARGAIQSIKNNKPDLVLLDITMPALPGDELASIINKDKSLKCKPRIVFYSNKSAAELEELVKRTDADGYFCKSDGPSALVRTVKETLE